jgi:hypothetical protein
VGGYHIIPIPPAEMVAQLLKRAGKRTWCPERVVRATGGGGPEGGAAAGVVLTAGLKVDGGAAAGLVQYRSVCRPA